MDPTLNEDTVITAEERAAAETAAQDAFENEFSKGESAADAADDTPAPAPAAAPAKKPAAASPAPAAPKKDSTSPPSTDEPATDPYAGLHPKVREDLAQLAELRHQVASLNGRFIASQKAAPAPSPAPAPGAAPAAPAPAPATPRAKREALRDELPEIAESLDEQDASFETRMAAIEARLAAAAPAAAPAPAPKDEGATADERTADEKLLDTEQPEWVSKFASTDFALWLGIQPPAFAQQVRQTTKATEVVAALAKFDVYQARLAAQREAEAEEANRTRTGRSNRVAAAAQAPRGNARPAAASVQDDVQAEFERGFANPGG